MELAIKILVGVVSTAAFLCLCCFVAQITFLKKTNWLYQRLHEREPRHLTYRQGRQRDAEKTYFGLCALGIVISVGAGTYAMLWWMPNNWGWHEDDSWNGLRLVIASLSAMFIGVPIVGSLSEFIKLKVKQHMLQRDLRVSESEVDGYKSIVECRDNVGLLEAQVHQFEVRLKELDTEKNSSMTLDSEDYVAWYRRRHSLMCLIATAKTQAEAFQKT